MARVLLISLLLSLVLQPSQGGTIGHICNLGEYVYMPSKGEHSVCRRCENQNFMNQTVHQETRCYPCSKVSDETAEYIVSECTRERNAIICPLDGYAHKVDDPTCQKIPGVCGPGGYLNSSDLCLKCSDDSYMPLKNHTNHDCYKCPTPDPNGHQTNLKRCTKTRPPDIGCEDGYFDMNKNSTHGVQCHKCKSCTDTVDLKYVGRNCTQFSDTVCCPQPNMEEDIEKCESSAPPTDHPSANGNNTRCKENQFLVFNETNGQSSCKPCPKDTYRQESNHTNRMCNNCSDYREDNPPQICHSETIGSVVMDTGIIVIIVLGSVAFVFFIVIVIICVRKHRNKKEPRNPDEQIPMNSDSGHTRSS